MANFHEVRFPTSISRRSTGGPSRRTEIVTLGSGAEERNSRWADSRRRYDAGLGIVSLNEIHQVIAFFEERRGRLFGFRWKDHADFKSAAPLQPVTQADQMIGTGDGANAVFQLQKTYGTGANAYVRKIVKPVLNTVVVAVDGVVQNQGIDITLDDKTGTVAFQPGKIPVPGAIVTAGFEFDVPVRFDSDRLEINLAAFDAGQVPQISIVEVRT